MSDMQTEQNRQGAPMLGLPSGAGHTEYANSPYKGRTSKLVVTNGAQQAAVPMFGQDDQRKYLYVVNRDPVGNVTMSVGNPAVFGVGFNLAAGGGGVMLDNNVPTEALYFVGDIASNPNVSVVIA